MMPVRSVSPPPVTRNKRKAAEGNEDTACEEEASEKKKKKASRKGTRTQASANAVGDAATVSLESNQDYNTKWNQMVVDLLLYKSENGDFNVKASDEERKPLHQWMKEQRDQYKLYSQDPSTSTLTQKQVAVLDYMQFPWVIRGAELWKKNYEKLKHFRSETGHVLVSRSHMNSKGLCDWVADQRRQYKFRMEGKTSSMTDERMELLNEVGFTWKVRERPGWDKRYEELIEFKNTHGHTKVPQHYPANKKLGKWTAKQREQYRLHLQGKHSYLSQDRIEQLNSVDFVWSCKGRSSTNSTNATTDEPQTDETKPAMEDQGAETLEETVSV